MLGLSVLAMATMLNSVQPAADTICGRGAAVPELNVTVSEDPIRFNTDKTRRQLATLHIDTVSPFPPEVHTEVGGLTHGGITLTHNLRFRRALDPVTHSGCLELDRVDIGLRINPTIYIANDLPNRACWFREIFVHEQKHVDADRALTATYEQRFKDALAMMFSAPPDYTAGPMPEAAMERASRRMHKSVAAALNVVFAQMQRDRAEAQAQVDTLAEYQRLTRTCGPAS
jgi:hypothetical protein